MQLLKKGKTKDVCDLDNGNYPLHFIDTTSPVLDNMIALVDEFSWGIMRVYKDGERLQPFELSRCFA